MNVAPQTSVTLNKTSAAVLRVVFDREGDCFSRPPMLAGWFVGVMSMMVHLHGQRISSRSAPSVGPS